MAISFKRYVNITSGVGAAAAVSRRDLMGRFFTSNNLLPPQTEATFDTLAEVGSYFGTGSTEYKRAKFYFNWVSKNITSPSKISFARWVSSAVGSMIYGVVGTYAVSQFTPISSGTLNLTLGGFSHQITGINLSAVGSLAAVAAALQTAIRAFSGGGTAWTGATVSYDTTGKRFDFVSGATGADVISIAGATSGTDLAPVLGWGVGAIFANGSAVETITQTLDASANASNNFGSFAFIDTLSQDQVVEAATWNAEQNVVFEYNVPVTAANAAAIQAAVANLGGIGLTLAPLSTEYPEQAPMMILAATDYDAVNSVQNYEFQIFDLTPSVTTDADADTYDAIGVNYYGQTQTAGQLVQFYQKGVLQGLPVDPLDMNTYANEIWLKDAIGAGIMSLQLALPQISADAIGRSQLLTIIQQTGVDPALNNGTITVGKPLTPEQKLYIGQITGDPNAWYQVQNAGYWLDVVITPFVVDGVTKYKAVYTLVYSKDDVIREVDGRDILI